jgi:hypothetical protein
MSEYIGYVCIAHPLNQALTAIKVKDIPHIQERHPVSHALIEKADFEADSDRQLCWNTR